ncbi:hypothetical protein CDV55_103486 [Aspergillus turcosus]|uniref:Glycoside hydrolase 131 catalytic N-terminal domain-containing protein n=1 Tax=Aspergillus turcosus TaxID=1245748 RepID=A0A229X167_9EURO|nr:hypothetical protein CDV55_103486 [Aspergillus turcosus]RLL99124.1 hypothetical protein CFD26_106393 [Aspergillus turcosus]
MRPFVSLLVFPASSLAGTVLWSGIFNSSATVEDFDDWSWSNQIEPWQWYIHGSGKTTEYLGLSPDYKNPADTSDAQGLRITIDGTSFWNGQTMERSELIPQTTADLGSGHLYYHFSLSTKTTNTPNASFEHQIAFFESHFTELKWRNTVVGSELEPGNWYNFAYDIDFASQKVGLWASNGSDPLTQVVLPVSASTASNSADWHVGQLRLPNGEASNDAAEDWFWSGIYVEEGPVTKEIGSLLDFQSLRRPINPSPVFYQYLTTRPAATTAVPATSEQASATQTDVLTATAPQVVTSAAAAPAVNTNIATPTEPSSAKSTNPTTAAQLLAEIQAAFRALIFRSNSMHARDFARCG